MGQFLGRLGVVLVMQTEQAMRRERARRVMCELKSEPVVAVGFEGEPVGFGQAINYFDCPGF